VLRAIFWLVFVVTLGEALQLHNAQQPPIAYELLCAALACALLATLAPLPAKLSARAFFGLALLALLLQLWELCTAQPSWSIKPGQPVFAVLLFGVLTCGLLAAVGLAERDPLGRARVPLLIAVHVVLGIYAVHATPDPWIDVHLFHTESFKDLLAGRSPYGQLRTNLYRAFPFYTPEVLTPDRAFVKVGFPYPPLQLLLTLPVQLIAGDYRYLQSVMLSASGLLMALARPTRVAAAAAALLLLTPRLYFVLEGSWTEPMVVFFLSLTLFCALRAPKLLPWALGGFLAIKQYTIVLLPLVPFLLPPAHRTRRAVALLAAKAVGLAAAITLPFFLWNPRGFLDDVLLFQQRQPFRIDSLSLMALGRWHGAFALPPWLCFALLFALLAAAGFFGEKSPRGFAAACALGFGAFFATGKQAFTNYYVFVLAAGAWALALSEEPKAEATAAQAAQVVNQGA